MLNPMRDKKVKACTGGERGRHLSPRLVQKIAQGKTSYELGWKVKVMIKIYIYIYILYLLPLFQFEHISFTPILIRAIDPCGRCCNRVTVPFCSDLFFSLSDNPG